MIFYFAVSSQSTTEFGIAGESKKLICPFTQNEKRSWWGPPDKLLFLNYEKNPSADRVERLFLVHNISSNAYDLLITNLTKGIDNGTYKCQVDKPDIFQQHLIKLEFFSKYENQNPEGLIYYLTKNLR